MLDTLVGRLVRPGASWHAHIRPNPTLEQFCGDTQVFYTGHSCNACPESEGPRGECTVTSVDHVTGTITLDANPGIKPGDILTC
jgi:hypothetical protein